MSKRLAIFKLLAVENQPLLFNRYAIFLFELFFHHLDRLCIFDDQGDRAAGKRLDVDLHGSSTERLVIDLCLVELLFTASGKSAQSAMGYRRGL